MQDTYVLNSLLDSVGEGEGGIIWENGIETCIYIICEMNRQVNVWQNQYNILK